MIPAHPPHGGFFAAAQQQARDSGGRFRAVVLVEGVSDQAAVETLAARLGRDLRAEGVLVTPMGGAHAIGKFVDAFGPAGFDVALTGLCDAQEAGEFLRGLGRLNGGHLLTHDELEAHGFFVCDADLEDELIRSLGTRRLEEIIAAEAELDAFRTLQHQPAQRGRSHHQQLRRFLGTKGGRKIRYGRILVDALDLSELPRPLERLLATL